MTSTETFGPPPKHKALRRVAYQSSALQNEVDAFLFIVLHVPAKLLITADTLSRAPLTDFQHIVR